MNSRDPNCLAEHPRVKLLVTVLSAALLSSCHQTPFVVGVRFDNTWTIRGEALDEGDVAIIKQSALDTLRSAYAGFAVQFLEGATGSRMIRVEDTPFGSGGGFRVFQGGAGLTYPGSMVSSVRFDVLAAEALTAAHCTAMTRCAMSRRQLLEGLGRGVGATAAHELGHQAALEFTRDARCDDCYDGATSRNAAHFFGQEHWSEVALTRMRLLLPPAGSE